MVLVSLTLGAGPYGLAEDGAKSLLVAWSIGDAVASAAFALGAPDVRVILFLPAGFLWPGQVIAARVLTLLVMAAAGFGLYRWRSRDGQGEAALLGTGLLLLAPGCVAGVGALSAAPYLLLCFVLADWLDRILPGEQGSLGASFFGQLTACAAAISLHPAGLAYPLMLMRRWLAVPAGSRHRPHFLAAIPLVTVLVLTIRLGWPGASWLHDPLPAAAAVFSAAMTADAPSAAATAAGVVLIALAAAVAAHEYRRLLADLTGAMLLVAVLLGAAAADPAWGLLLLALVLYGGLPWLLRGCARLAGRGVLVQRGWLWLLLLALCTTFMRVDRAQYEAVRHNRLSAQDQLLQEFSEGLTGLRNDTPAGEPAATPSASAKPAASGAPVMVASSWPARTSIACRCDGLPLPPAASDPESQLAMMRGVSYMILADDGAHPALDSNLAQLSRHVEVVSREPAGVILHFR